MLAGASGHGLTAQLVSGTASGTLTLHKDGSFTYVPAGGASGIVHFTYKVADLDSATSKPATVTVEVSAGRGRRELFGRLGRDAVALRRPAALRGYGTGLTPSLLSTTSHGSLSLGAGGMTYSPTPGFSGTDSFTYDVVDADGPGVQHGRRDAQRRRGPAQRRPAGVHRGRGQHAACGRRQPGRRPGGLPGRLEPLLAGDSDPNGGGALTITPETVSTARGGSVTVASDGSFAYTPPAGFDGPAADSFSYQVNTTEGTSASETATISFAATRVWYVNNAGANGNGTAGSPFNTLGAATAVASSGDDIYLSTGSGNYAGGVVLAPGVSLVGQGSALAVGNETLTAAGTAPVITNGSGDGITIQGDATVSGVNVHSTTGNGVSATGSGTSRSTRWRSARAAATASTPPARRSSPSPARRSPARAPPESPTAAPARRPSDRVRHDLRAAGAALALNGFNGGVNGEVQGIISETAIGDGSTSGTGGQGIRLSDASGAFVVAALGNTVGQVASGAAYSSTGRRRLRPTSRSCRGSTVRT